MHAYMSRSNQLINIYMDDNIQKSSLLSKAMKMIFIGVNHFLDQFV